MIWLALAMGRVMGPSSAAAGVVTRAFFDLLRLYPPASDYVLQMRYKPKPRFSKGFLMPRGRSGGDLHGRLFPQGRVRTAEGHSVLLDDVLGTGFALVCLTDDPRNVFDGWADSIRRELQPVCVAVLPRGSSIPSIRGVTMVRDEEETMAAAMRGAREAIYLLRPDRYVAGTFPLTEARRIPGLIDQWLAVA
jgi:3-(3-hydroxy-phenyl)propionate hydroxylase